MDNPFWQFSLKYYRFAGVEALCLQLQEECGVNVNILLWGLWLASVDKPLGSKPLSVAVTAIGRWDSDFIQPLRQMRRQLKSQPQQLLRDKILAAELEGERVQQQLLFDLSNTIEQVQRDGLRLNLETILTFYNAQGELERALTVCEAAAKSLE